LALPSEHCFESNEYQCIASRPRHSPKHPKAGGQTQWSTGRFRVRWKARNGIEARILDRDRLVSTAQSADEQGKTQITSGLIFALISTAVNRLS
jgi:hypothetical protein